MPEQTAVSVAGLPDDFTDDDLRDLFANFGPIASVACTFGTGDRTSGAASSNWGTAEKCGVVVFTNDWSVNKAVSEMVGYPLCGKTLRVARQNSGLGKLRGPRGLMSVDETDGSREEEGEEAAGDGEENPFSFMLPEKKTSAPLPVGLGPPPPLILRRNSLENPSPHSNGALRRNSDSARRNSLEGVSPSSRRASLPHTPGTGSIAGAPPPYGSLSNTPQSQGITPSSRAGAQRRTSGSMSPAAIGMVSPPTVGVAAGRPPPYPVALTSPPQGDVAPPPSYAATISGVVTPKGFSPPGTSPKANTAHANLAVHQGGRPVASQVGGAPTTQLISIPQGVRSVGVLTTPPVQIPMQYAQQPPQQPVHQHPSGAVSPGSYAVQQPQQMNTFQQAPVVYSSGMNAVPMAYLPQQQHQQPQLQSQHPQQQTLHQSQPQPQPAVLSIASNGQFGAPGHSTMMQPVYHQQPQTVMLQSHPGAPIQQVQLYHPGYGPGNQGQAGGVSQPVTLVTTHQQQLPMGQPPQQGVAGPGPQQHYVLNQQPSQSGQPAPAPHQVLITSQGQPYSYGFQQQSGGPMLPPGTVGGPMPGQPQPQVVYLQPVAPRM